MIQQTLPFPDADVVELERQRETAYQKALEEEFVRQIAGAAIYDMLRRRTAAPLRRAARTLDWVRRHLP